MPLPMWAAALGAQALQNPEVQQGLYNVGSGIAGGIGRGAKYVGEGLTGNILQPAFNKLGDLGNQYLPTRLAGLGTSARQGLYGFGQAITGAQPGQGLWDTINGRNLPPQAGGMPGAMGGGQQAMGPMNPERAMQQAYMQQIQQPYQFDYANQRQQLMDQYNQQLLPQLAQRFGGAGALSSGAFRRAATGAAGNLQTGLGALEELGRGREAELNQQRLGNIGQYLGNQQQLGLNARRLAQEGTIAERQDALRQLGVMGGFAQQRQQDYMNQLLNALNIQQGLGGVGMGQAFQPVQQQGAPSGFAQLLPFLAQGAMGGVNRAMGF